MDCEIRPLYIRSAENKMADYFSRLASPRDYHIDQSVFDEIMSTVLQCTVDAFASAATARLPRYWSHAPEPGAEATDAFLQWWEPEIVWAHPPPWVLPQVVQLLRQHEFVVRLSAQAERLVCVLQEAPDLHVRHLVLGVRSTIHKGLGHGPVPRTDRRMIEPKCCGTST